MPLRMPPNISRRLTGDDSSLPVSLFLTTGDDHAIEFAHGSDLTVGRFDTLRF